MWQTMLTNGVLIYIKAIVSCRFGLSSDCQTQPCTSSLLTANHLAISRMWNGSHHFPQLLNQATSCTRSLALFVMANASRAYSQSKAFDGVCTFSRSAVHPFPKTGHPALSWM